MNIMATSKSKTQAKPNKAIAKANQTALKGFPKSKLKKAFDVMAGKASDSDAATEARQAAALEVVRMAHDFAGKNDGVDVESLVTGWRDNLQVLIMELAVAGNRFAELSEGKDGKAATAKLTGYGNNVASIAKGIIEFEAEPAESYRETRKLIEGLRQEKRRTENPELAALTDSKSACDEAWKALRTRVFELNEIGSVNSLTEMLTETLGDVNKQIETKIKAEAEADAAKAETVETAEAA
jgi:hypothetical protein